MISDKIYEIINTLSLPMVSIEEFPGISYYHYISMPLSDALILWRDYSMYLVT